MLCDDDTLQFFILLAHMSGPGEGLTLQSWTFPLLGESKLR